MVRIVLPPAAWRVDCAAARFDLARHGRTERLQQQRSTNAMLDPERARTRRIRLIDALPTSVREPAAEAFLRRPGTPGPAAEHVLQHLVGTWTPSAAGKRSKVEVIAQGADDFYARQYRQRLNATMGAFAATASHALLGAGTTPHGSPTRRRRTARAAVVGGRPTIAPVLVLDERSVAIAIPVPRELVDGSGPAFDRWLAGAGPLPPGLRRAIDGRTVATRTRRSVGVERSSVGSALEVADAAIATGRLAVLALHPTDPDAMGLHITLYGVVGRDAAALAAEHGLGSGALTEMVDAAGSDGDALIFLVGATEEVFTQCSQNLFVKRPAGAAAPGRPEVTWSPSDPLADLVGTQFELLQVTVSSMGLPGGSPRNGDVGSVAYVIERDEREVLLIPYHPGNFIHGHAAKLWSNPNGAIVIRDDHRHLRTVILHGPARVLDPVAAARQHGTIVSAEIARTASAPGDRRPAYWFEQQVARIVVQTDPVPAMILDPGRATCTISAAGQGRHGKKPAYFDAGSLEAYDPTLQHHREAEGRPVDPTGTAHRAWVTASAAQLDARRTHLRTVADSWSDAAR